MFRFILITGILALSLFIFGFWLMFSEKTPTTVVLGPERNEHLENRQQITTINEQQKISSNSGKFYDADTIITDTRTEELRSGYYSNTTDESRYLIGYLESQGVITVHLLHEDLAVARLLAEEQLRSMLSYSDQELCDMNIRVYTNEHVVPDYDGRYFGLSFCPFSDPLN